VLTITNTGAADVSCNFSCGEKARITVKATMGRDGTKLPLWAIANGLRRLNKFEENVRVAEETWHGWLHQAYSKSGWTDQDVAMEYPKRLSKVAHNQTQYLIWGVYRSHRSESVKTTAAQVKIHLSFVPSGLTGPNYPISRSISVVTPPARASS